MSDDTSRFFAGGGIQVSAPGRVNLLGEHTDYNDGFMLPVATPQRTDVQVAPQPSTSHFHVYSGNLDENADFAADGELRRTVRQLYRRLHPRGARPTASTVPPLRM